MNLVGQTYGNWTVEAFHDRNEAVNTNRWMCKCVCGKIKPVFQTSLRSGKSTSCGCKAYDKAPACTLPAGESAFRHVFRQYKRDAEKRGYDFNLLEYEAKALMLSNCYYCGSEPSTVQIPKTTGDSRFVSNFTYNGIDRMHNGIGYDNMNCVSCCRFCNVAKGTRSFNEFIAWFDRAASFRLFANLNSTLNDIASSAIQ